MTKPDLKPCPVCKGEKRICTGISFPPNSTIAVKCEYERCPECQPGPHSGYARRRADARLRAKPKPTIPWTQDQFANA
jgi:hypothetical protein